MTDSKTNLDKVVYAVPEVGWGVPSGCSPIHGEYNAPEIKLHLKNGINPNNTCRSGMTPLHCVRNSEIANILIEAGADVNTRDSHLMTPLHFAPDAESVKIMIKHGANPNSRDGTGSTPLHTAKNVQVAEALINAGADINAYNQDRDTPLHVHFSYGSQYHHHEICQFLVAAKADLSLENRAGIKPMTQASNSRQAFHGREALLLPSIILGIIIFLMLSSWLKKLKLPNGSPSIFLKIAAFFSLSFNPVYFHLSLALLSYTYISYTYSLLYWVPGTITMLILLFFLFSFIIYHGCMFLFFLNKCSGINLTKALDIYMLKNLFYLKLFPYYLLFGIGFFIKSSGDDALDWFFVFLGIPYMLIVSRIAYNKSQQFYKNYVN